MSVSLGATLIVLAIISGSYGWGMRGTTLGGEKGAMLPGALLGILFAFFTGSPIIIENFWIFAAVGSASMYFGGTETYGQTLGLSMDHKPATNYWLGMAGIFIKGGLWFSIFGAFLGIALAAMTGAYYKWYDFVILFALMPLVRKLGIWVLNSPYKPAEKKFPKIYFSIDRREEWGSLLFVLIELIVFMAIRKDTYALLMTLATFFIGSFSWIIGHNAQIFTRWPMKNGKYFFGSWQKNGFVDNWKIMECIHGALLGLGFSVYFIANFEKLKEYTAIIEQNGKLWNPMGDYGFILAWIWVIFLMLDMLQFVFKPKQANRAELADLYRRSLISKEEYEIETAKGTDAEPSKCYQRYARLVEVCERPLYSYVPLLLSLLGGITAAQIGAFYLLYWVDVEKVLFRDFKYFKNPFIFKILLLGGAGAILAGHYFIDGSYTMLQTWVLYCVLYELLQFIIDFRPRNFQIARENNKGCGAVLKTFGSRLTMHPYFILCIIVMLVAGFILF